MRIKKIPFKIIVTLTFLFLLLTYLMPSSSAAITDDWFVNEPVIEVEYDSEYIYDPITPYSAPTDIPIRVKIKISGINQHIVAKRYSNQFFYIDLSLEEVPEWCKATIFPTLIQMPVDQKWQYANATVTLTLDRNSPAFEVSYLKIKIESRGMGNKATVIKKGNVTRIIPFTVGYVSLLGINELEGNHKQITPDETARFPIEVINLGNGITDINTDILSIPDGWYVDIIPIVTVDEFLGGSYKTILNLVVKPPVNFGYREDREEIKISITPSSNYNSSYEGEDYLLSFFVYSRGFSTPGFEAIFLIFGIILVLFIIRKNRSSGCKNYMSRKLGGEKL